MNEKIKNILSVYAPRLQWLIYDLKTYSLDEDPITLHLTGGDVIVSLNSKNKTTMTKEKVKQVLPLMQAFAEGKTIQTKNGSRWIDIDSDKDQLNLDSVVAYPDCFRIKPKDVYRPFKDTEECWKEMQKHQPFGYIIDKTTKLFSNIGILDNQGILTLCTQYSCSLKESFNKYTFADGTPFGIKEE